MTILLNGKEHPMDQSMTVLELLTSIGLAEKPVVVELNQKALFPREYTEQPLSNGDKLEIITIAAGG